MSDDHRTEGLFGKLVWPASDPAKEALGTAGVRVVKAEEHGSTIWLTVVGPDKQHSLWTRGDFSPEPMVDEWVAPGQTPREEILEEAARTIMGDRRRTYGDAQESFGRIAALWSAILQTHVTATQVALCMAALKISRAVGAPDHRDSFVDLAGYAALAFELDPPAAPLPEGDPR